jgi:hypothetical protein
MARYDRYGGLDDQIVEDLDIGFSGYNNKLRPDQLKQGVLAESLNGRMGLGGEWKVRKGIDLVAAPFAVGNFTVPFYVYANFTVTTANIARTDTTLTFTASSHGLTTSTLVSLAGLGTAGVDPNGNHIITVTDSNTFTITISGLTGKPSGTATIGAPKIDEDANVQIYGSTSWSDPSASTDTYVVCAGNTKAIAVKLSDGSTTDVVYPTGVTITSSVEMIQAFRKIFIFRDGAVALEWDGDFSGTPAFALVGNGDYTQPAKLDATGFTIVNGLATVTVSNTLAIGDTVVLTTVGGSSLAEGSEHTVATRSSSAFTFYVDHADVSNQTDTEWTKKVSGGLGFIYMPAPKFGIIHQSRLVLPFDYVTSGSSGSATITNRGIRDEVIFSDILDTNTYDQIYGQFRLNAGSSDFIVGFLSFAEDKLVVFNRNSIHLISGGENPRTATSQVITGEVGNFLNKQWESVDSVNNSDWESHNLIVAGNGNERGVYVINQQGGVHRLDSRTDDVDAVITQIGSAQKNITILGSATTRMFTAQSVDRKKWNNWDLHIQSSDFNESNATIQAITENIDDTINIGTILEYNGKLLEVSEDVSLRGRFGNRRAYGLQFKLDTTQGRPKFRALKVAGAQTFRHSEKAD